MPLMGAAMISKQLAPGGRSPAAVSSQLGKFGHNWHTGMSLLLAYINQNSLLLSGVVVVVVATEVVVVVSVVVVVVGSVVVVISSRSSAKDDQMKWRQGSATRSCRNTGETRSN